ncbi:hypothetical protein VSDG_07251 [Cytospora chrysosperma]|uniref:Uncharacterized protein n=1 Tax=Cytospora chrysosperma TaxID=252740 RepID=A0A423VMS3_CYTCH|nr:hypothetical protein VSDG_07251 [Valsa sordida]
MRFTNLILSAVALLSANAVAVPTPNEQIGERTPGVEAEPIEARKVYTSWYRATNIIGEADN